MPGSKLSNLRDRLAAMRAARLDSTELSELLLEIIEAGGGVSVDVDGSRYKVYRRDMHYSVTPSETRRPPPMPAPRRK